MSERTKVERDDAAATPVLAGAAEVAGSGSVTGVVTASPDTVRHSDDLASVIRGYRRSLVLGSFLNAGRAPTISSVEVVICFADIRGFTSYVRQLQADQQDAKVEHFLRAYFPIFPHAVLEVISQIESSSPSPHLSAEVVERIRLAIPTTYKNLGDGMMLVWELQESPILQQQYVIRAILNVLQGISTRFAFLTTGAGPGGFDVYSRRVQDLRLGFGLARGRALRLDFGHNLAWDYAGSTVNLAARLQDRARPEGLVAHLSVSETLLRELAAAGKGEIVGETSLKGFAADAVEVFKARSLKLGPM